MLEPAVPCDESQRLRALHSLNVLFTPAEERFDRITRLATRLLGAPIAVVSLVAARCQWFKSIQGLDATETPREISFCGHAILGDETFVVENADLDPRFHDNPLVTDAPSIRFYAGQPLHAEDGSRVGTLCVIDRAPRRFSDDEREVLRDLAVLVETELQRGQLTESQLVLTRQRDDMQRRAMIDGLTRLWNRSTVMELLGEAMIRSRRDAQVCVAMVDIDHFKQVNDTFGHPAGDAVLTEVATRIRQALRETDVVGRYGGEEFLLVLSGCALDVAKRLVERVRISVSQAPIEIPGGTSTAVTVSAGIAGSDLGTCEGSVLIARADRALYRAKHAGRNRVEFDDGSQREA